MSKIEDFFKTVAPPCVLSQTELDRLNALPKGPDVDGIEARYLELFPEDKAIFYLHICGISTPEDAYAAYDWGLKNQRHWWEYPDLHPELVPDYWPNMYRDHPDWVF